MRVKSIASLICLFAFGVFFASATSDDSKVEVVWGAQIGTEFADFPNAVAVGKDGTCAFTGTTEGDLAGTNQGDIDVIVGMLDKKGTLIWKTQFGSSFKDSGTGIVYGSDGSLYVAGTAGDSMGSKDKGGKGLGDNDAFLAKIDKSGKLQWIQRIGTSGSDTVNSLAIDAKGDMFIAGYTDGTIGKSNLGGLDAYIVKIDSNGKALWSTQIGSEGSDKANCVSICADGSILVAGDTEGIMGKESLGRNDMFACKLNPSGNPIWTKQYGSDSDDHASSFLQSSDGSMFLSGSTNGDMPKQLGSGDSILIKLSSTGEQAWTRQFGTSDWDGIHGMALPKDLPGGILVSGCQRWPSCQAFVRCYNANGNELWKIEIGEDFPVCGQRVCVDDSGNCYTIGGTHGALYSDYEGADTDIFIAKIGKAIAK